MFTKFTTFFRSGQRSGEAASNTGCKKHPITHPAYGLFWRHGMSPIYFLRHLPNDLYHYARRILYYARTGVPYSMTYEYYSSFADLTTRALEDYLSSHYGTPLSVPTLASLQARVFNPTADLEYIDVQTDEAAADKEWEKIIQRLLELLHWMDEMNEIYEGWLDEVYEKWLMASGPDYPLTTARGREEYRKVHTEISASTGNAKREFFTIMCEIYYNLWD